MNDPFEPFSADTPDEHPGTPELELLLAQPIEQRRSDSGAQRIDGVIVGTLIGFRDSHEPLVTYPGQPGSAALTAKTTIDLDVVHIGHELTLVFENGDPQRPIVTGRIR